jgi:hypothetical protein
MPYGIDSKTFPAPPEMMLDPRLDARQIQLFVLGLQALGLPHRVFMFINPEQFTTFRDAM